MQRGYQTQHLVLVAELAAQHGNAANADAPHPHRVVYAPSPRPRAPTRSPLLAETSTSAAPLWNLSSFTASPWPTRVCACQPARSRAPAPPPRPGSMACALDWLCCGAQRAPDEADDALGPGSRQQRVRSTLPRARVELLLQARVSCAARRPPNIFVHICLKQCETPAERQLVHGHLHINDQVHCAKRAVRAKLYMPSAHKT